MRLDETEAIRLAAAADHGVLATVNPAHGADAVPVCFVLDGNIVATPIDDVKPKDTIRLRRRRNIELDPRATLLCEHWDADDWSRLWWVRLRLHRSTEDETTIRRCEVLLREKYAQYVDASFAAILTLRVTGVSGWSAAAAPEARSAAR